MTHPVIRIRDGQFGYRNQVAVRAALEIESTEIVALLGPNGSGKTTLLKGMLGLVDRIGGSVELFGQPMREFKDRSLIGYVPQRQSAAGSIPVTVRELVRSGRTGRNWSGSSRAAGRQAVADAIAAVGLADKATDPVSTLSGGQQRRAMMARALAGGANVLLLDEPFAGVDQANQHAIADALAALVPGGATIVVVLHELGPIEPMVTRTICLDGGSVLYDGPLADAPPRLLHLGHDHDPHGGEPDGAGGADEMGLFRR
ncbi:MAG: ATP-binding cassette domain-containing protein [Ilumatobacteraceae bacterium]